MIVPPYIHPYNDHNMLPNQAFIYTYVGGEGFDLKHNNFQYNLDKSLIPTNLRPISFNLKYNMDNISGYSNKKPKNDYYGLDLIKLENKNIPKIPKEFKTFSVYIFINDNNVNYNIGLHSLIIPKINTLL